MKGIDYFKVLINDLEINALNRTLNFYSNYYYTFFTAFTRKTEIPVIEGGFGPNQKVILAKTIAEIHGIRLLDVNALINNNIDEFEIDLLDLTNSNDSIVSLLEMGFSNFLFSLNDRLRIFIEFSLEKIILF